MPTKTRRTLARASEIARTAYLSCDLDDDAKDAVIEALCEAGYRCAIPQADNALGAVKMRGVDHDIVDLVTVFRRAVGLAIEDGDLKSLAVLEQAISITLRKKAEAS